MPLMVTTLPGSLATQSLSGSGNYFRLTRTTASAQTKLQMLSSAGTPRQLRRCTYLRDADQLIEGTR